jgi:RHS repeat-associated protein
VGVCATSAGAHPSSGLLRARDYDTDTGRFDAVDAFGNANQRSAVSTYAYADQNPLVGADPSGRWWIPIPCFGGDPAPRRVQQRAELPGIPGHMTRRRFLRHGRSAAWLALVASLAGCTGHSRSGQSQDRFVRADAPRTSPSGKFVASFRDGPAQNGVPTWIVVIKDTTGHVVFDDGYAYSRRHGVGATWLSTGDQLWILSSDVGTAHVDPVDGGGWVKTSITPDTVASVPEEIQKLQ